jgi:hypothetical protein
VPLCYRTLYVEWVLDYIDIREDNLITHLSLNNGIIQSICMHFVQISTEP